MKPRHGSLMALALFATVPLTACGGPAVDCSATVSTTRIPAPATPETQTFPWDAVDYFVEITFGAEYGSSDAVIHRWTEDVKIAVHGDPTEADLDTLCDIVDDLNGLIDTVEVSVVGSGQNVDLYFVPEDQFSRIEAGVVPGNWGFFLGWWDDAGNIYKASVLVSTTKVTQEERNHLIREELTQSLGLMQDSYDYPDSIFYQEWTDTQEYSDLDEKVIEILYLPEVVPGMTPDEVRAALSQR